MESKTRLEAALADKGNRIATANFVSLFHKRFTEMRIERLHMLQVFNFHRKPKATMLADFNNFTRARRIYSIAFGSQKVNSTMREFLVRERIEHHFKTALDVVMVLERMQNGNMRRERRISLTDILTYTPYTGAIVGILIFYSWSYLRQIKRPLDFGITGLCLSKAALGLLTGSFPGFFITPEATFSRVIGCIVAALSLVFMYNMITKKRTGVFFDNAWPLLLITIVVEQIGWLKYL